MIGLKIGIAVFISIWIWIIYEWLNAPHMDDNGNEIKKNDVKPNNLLDFDENEEFLG